MNERTDLQDLYRRTVLDHSRHPHNFARPEKSDRVSVGHNPLCGDKITVYLNLDDDRIENLCFEGKGCAISIASASIMTDVLENRNIEDAREAVGQVLRQFESGPGNKETITGDMAALSGVRDYPSRIKCATLAWKTLESALLDRQGTTTTEN